MGRKRLYSDEQIVAALTETKGMVYLAADRVGCSPDTIYARAEKSKAVKDAIRNERGKVVDTAELKLFDAIQRDEPWAIRMALMTIGKDRGYQEKAADPPPPAPPTGGISIEDAVRLRDDLARRDRDRVGRDVSGAVPVVPEGGAAGGGVPVPGG